ncbi:hypothetical protein [Alienimonas californiensis]|uniref:Uncharacterized protein n=1 Tax=Alienimonas californiensis TaxID=2527989 RepID=A0A517P7N4_9PLAN|nr:hypothetical protein [Alienimonas californiensis]QDT15387.1 Hypothetical protein CA12_14720 [Alienimonas californiensis]
MSGLFDSVPPASPPPPGGLIVGVDEAGLGPNLGPLVIGVSVWRTRGEPWPDSQWSGDPIDGLPGVLSRTVAADRLCIADSKAVYAPGGGLSELSRSARTALAVCGQAPDTLRTWLDALGSPSPLGGAQEWFNELKTPLPDAAGLPELAAAWRNAGAAAGLELVGLHADVLFAPRFNADLVRLGGKGRLLTGASLGLLARVWDPATAPPTRVECDKHGGRNFYAAALAEAFDELPAIVREGAAGSEYTLNHGRHRLGFRPRNEAFGPVALASLVAKFTRELLMEHFNAWWAERVPGLRPTAGYPVDAQRFRADTADARTALGVPDDAFWRAK